MSLLNVAKVLTEDGIGFVKIVPGDSVVDRETAADHFRSDDNVCAIIATYRLLQHIGYCHILAVSCDLTLCVIFPRDGYRPLFAIRGTRVCRARMWLGSAGHG